MEPPKATILHLTCKTYGKLIERALAKLLLIISFSVIILALAKTYIGFYLAGSLMTLFLIPLASYYCFLILIPMFTGITSENKDIIPGIALSGSFIATGLSLRYGILREVVENNPYTNVIIKLIQLLIVLLALVYEIKLSTHLARQDTDYVKGYLVGVLAGFPVIVFMFPFALSASAILSLRYSFELLLVVSNWAVTLLGLYALKLIYNSRLCTKSLTDYLEFVERVSRTRG